MKQKVFFLILAIVALLMPLPSAYPVEWYDDTEPAMRAASDQHKPLMIFFYTPECGYCDKMKTKTFADSGVSAMLEKFVCIRIDADVNRDFAEITYKVRGYPTIVFHGPTGEIIERMEGYRSPAEFLEVLDSVLGAYGPQSSAEAAPPAGHNFQISPALKEHYELLRKEIFGGALRGTPHQNIRFYLGAVLHDLGEIEWPACVRYYQENGVYCHQQARGELYALAIKISGGARNYGAIRKIYEYARSNIECQREEGEIPKFPYETLAYGSGDCEDQAMLLAALLKLAGFESGIVVIDDYISGFGHAFCIVKADPRTASGVLWKFDRYVEYGNCWKILDTAYRQNFDDIPRWFNRYLENGEPYIPSNIAIIEALVISRQEYDRLSAEDDTAQESPLLKEDMARGTATAATAVSKDGLEVAPNKIMDLEKIDSYKDEWGKCFITYGAPRELTNEEVVQGLKIWQVVPDNIIMTIVPLAERISPVPAGGLPAAYKERTDEKVVEVYFEIDYYGIYITGRGRYANVEDMKKSAEEAIAHLGAAVK